MSFKIERANRPQTYIPEGRYLVEEGRDWLIQDISISSSGNICLRLNDPIRKESQVKTLCSLEELIQATVEGGSIKIV